MSLPHIYKAEPTPRPIPPPTYLPIQVLTIFGQTSYFLNMPRSFPPQGLCTNCFLCFELSSLDLPMPTSSKHLGLNSNVPPMCGFARLQSLRNLFPSLPPPSQPRKHPLRIPQLNLLLWTHYCLKWSYICMFLFIICFFVVIMKTHDGRDLAHYWAPQCLIQYLLNRHWMNFRVAREEQRWRAWKEGVSCKQA